MKLLPPIHDDPRVGDLIEEAINKLMFEEVYKPLSELMMEKDKIENKLGDKSALVSAIRGASITFYRGMFRGKFSSAISKELRSIGAKWDSKDKSYKIVSAKLPEQVKSAISASKDKFDRMALAIDKKLSQILPEEISKKLSLTKVFDSAFYKIDHELKGALEIKPDLTDESRARLVAEYQKNYQLKIKDWTKTEVLKLRKQVQESALAGNRYEYLVDKIQKSYGVSANKAKFLARQETNLVMAKYKEVRYQDAGLEEYIWKCSSGGTNNPVRPMHKKLDGTKQRFDKPPVVNLKGDRKTPAAIGVAGVMQEPSLSSSL